MIVQALLRHRARGEPREVGAVFHVPPTTGQHLARAGFVRIIASNEDWYAPFGRDLRTEPLPETPWPTVTACLNIWNDRPALERTVASWLGQVDHLVVADGPYRGVASEGRSTDDLGEMLESLTEQIGVTQLPPRVYASQNEKRTALLQAAVAVDPLALLFIVDADEFLCAADLHLAPTGDVGWVVLTSPMYQRPYGQPRLIRARADLAYKGRHHWLYAGERLLATHQYGGPGFEHRAVPALLRNERGMGHTMARHQAKQRGRATQGQAEAQETTGQAADKSMAGRESLRILQTTTYDPGLVAFRLHTALNSTTPHASVFLRRGHDNPFSSPRQYDPDTIPQEATRFVDEADVVHCHLDYSVFDSFRRGKHRPAVVIHHHGTNLRNHATAFATLDQRADLRLVSNLELLSYGERLQWLPNPVNVARLQRLGNVMGNVAQNVAQNVAGNVITDGVLRPFRVAHSPTKRHLKGTEYFLLACEALQAKGLPIEPVLIEGLSHAESLRRKATCDACFDSFWLGLQCSGLEAAAMGLPVIAGDPLVKERYEDLVGAVPYTYANDADALATALERLATDAAWRAAEAQRTAAYVLAWHDDAAVAARYLDLLDEAIHWRAAKTLGPPVLSEVVS